MPGYGQSTYNISINQNGKDDDLFFINGIDSITFKKEGEKDLQIVWNEGVSYTYPTEDIKEVIFTNSNTKYLINHNTIEYYSSIITTYGDYGVLQRDTISNNGFLALFGHKYEDSFLIVKLDSIGLIKMISFDGFKLSLHYTGSNINIASWNNEEYEIIAQIPYENIVAKDDSYSLKDGYGWGRFICILTNIICNELKIDTNNKHRLLLQRLSNLHEEIDNEQLTSTKLRKSNPRKNRQIVDDLLFLRGLGTHIIELNWLELLNDLNEVNERIERRVWYGWLDIQTLGATKESLGTYKLSCKITGYSEKRFQDFGGYTNLGMKLYKSSDPDNYKYQEKEISKDGTYDFTFPSLSYSTEYSYIPSVYLWWYETVGGAANISMSGLIDGHFPSGGVTITPVKAKVIFGEERTFTTDAPDLTGWWTFNDGQGEDGGRTHHVEFYENGNTNNFFGVNHLYWSVSGKSITLHWPIQGSDSYWWEYRGEFNDDFTVATGNGYYCVINYITGYYWESDPVPFTLSR